ncbi:TPA: replication initiation factor domain-containing protein [Staphylococcus aureus]|uniref:replication initiation factor domain-containing protein n=1 Tax=Staphylococcus aureus TaxID=1280 RepID=UPI000447FFA0|nr:replication initiation factor domain-containing protein [Staphylococcus aureus]EJN0115769.1 replication initiation factor domain-containing protein [Staphylococcus aureus]EZT74032.1 hypothetical protein V103_02706 [Staphylococcus aureus 22(2K81-5)]EZT79408.1 hypothetical protein V082_02754 [Staphylococcus aureus 2011-60-2275-7]EZV58141.1 hypothetical protein V074_02532 [Staphylococcus aureus 2010-60-1240-1]EZV84214.1 hypothetical protein V081_02677 [Staphylococcus aureus 2011-60-2275-1]
MSHNKSAALAPKHHTNRCIVSANQNELGAVVDWVQVTFKGVSPQWVIEYILKMPVSFFRTLNYGRNYYNRSLQFSSIKIYYSTTNEDMGVHLFLSGSACREVEMIFEQQARTWQSFFKLCLERRGSFSRIDIAIDDRKPYFSVGALGNKVKKGELVTRLRTSNKTEGLKTSDGSNQGKTLYIGSKISSVLIRIYEKNYEQAHKYGTLPEDYGPWNRIEICCRKKQANVLAPYLAETSEMQDVVLSVLNGTVRFISKPKGSNDTDKRRWPIYKPWELFIKNASKIKLSLVPSMKTIEDNMEWLKSQVATTLQTVLYAEDYAHQMGYLLDSDFLEDILQTADLEDEHLERIRLFTETLKHHNKQAVNKIEYGMKPTKTYLR